MRLVACPECHAQYDVSDVGDAKTLPCRCGARVDTAQRQAVESKIHRCGSCGGSVDPNAERCSYCASQLVRAPEKLSLICPECFARSADDSRFCTACGIAFRPEKIAVDGYELPCPRCAALMPPRRVGGVGVNECTTCHGLWVSGDGFDRLVHRAIEARRNEDPVERLVRKPRVSGANPAGQRVQYHNCPECDAFMQRRNYRKKSGVIIDSCPAHGTWLDADELEQIAGFVLSGAAAGAPEHVDRPNQRALAAAAAIEARERSRPPTSTGALGSRSGEHVIETVVDLLSSLFD